MVVHVAAASVVVATMSCDVGLSTPAWSLDRALVTDNVYWVPAEADTMIRRDRANGNDGSGAVLALAKDARGRALIRVNQDQMALVSSLGTVSKAWIEVGVRASDGRTPLVGESLAVHRLTTSWSDDRATWNCAADSDTSNGAADCSGSTSWSMGSSTSPPYAGASDTISVSATTSGMLRFDVTADVLAMLGGGTTNHGWLLKKDDESQPGRYDLYSREAAILQPRLLIALSPGPPPPSSDDVDGDGIPNIADLCPNDPWNDADLDGVCGDVDVCGAVADPTQQDTDGDGLGDACDLDGDGDGFRGDEGDCDDSTSAFSPSAAETCGDLLDQDCDGRDERCPPPDPSTLAPPLDQTVATTLNESVSFLYTGTDPIQAGVAPGTIDPNRVAVVRGRVVDRAGSAVASVEVSVPDMPELGTTVTRSDGRFDFVVNAYRTIVMRFHKNKAIDVHRTFEAPSQGWLDLGDIALTAYDAVKTNVDFAALTEVAVHRASVVTDNDGTRQATMLFFPGTQAVMTTADGSQQELQSGAVRITEYTFGSDGEAAMPSNLPPTSAYTYAAELSIDEAVQAGATNIVFSHPVHLYFENYLGLPVGAEFPFGYFDRVAGLWIPGGDGEILEIVSITAGLADLDFDGDGLAEGAAVLGTRGVTDDERATLAATYAVGQELWRKRIFHFTPVDCNFSPRLPSDAKAPDGEFDECDHEEICPDEEAGSIVDVQNQTLGESIAVAGVPFRLHYRSRSLDGQEPTVTIGVTGATIPASVQEVTLEISIAGQHHRYSYTPATNLSQTFTWNGLDVYGRRVQGSQRLVATIGYVYPGAYEFCEFGGANQSYFLRSPREGCPTSAIGSFAVNRPYALSRTIAMRVGGFNPRGLGFGGWSLDAHHALDRAANKVRLGSGRSFDLGSFGVWNTIAGDGNPCTGGPCGDGLPASEAQVSPSLDGDTGPDGTLYFIELDPLLPPWGRIRHIDRDGRIETIAGGGVIADDEIPATSAQIAPLAVAVAPDGTVYLRDYSGIRFVGVDGFLHTLAGGPVGGAGSCPGGDHGQAIAASMSDQERGLAVGPDGSIFFTDHYCTGTFGPGSSVRRITPDGKITAFAGRGSDASLDDGDAAIDLAPMFTHVETATDGSVYLLVAISTGEVNRVARVGVDGLVELVAGVSSTGPSTDDGGAATAARIVSISDFALDHDGTVFVLEEGNWAGSCSGAPANAAIRAIGADGIINLIASNHDCRNVDALYPVAGYPLRGTPIAFGEDDLHFLSLNDDGRAFISGVFEADDSSRSTRSILETTAVARVDRIPSPDGKSVHIFDAQGRHLRTVDALTNAIRFEMQYDVDGRLSSVVDGDGLVTGIERDANGEAAAIVGPYGHRTALSTTDGLLTSVTDPNGSIYSMTYKSGTALLETFEDPNGGASTLTYDAQGRLVLDEDAAGGSKALARTAVSGGYEVELTTAEGRTRTYGVSEAAGGQERTNTASSGLATTKTLDGDGTRSVTRPDGSSHAVKLEPDPRFGMAAPIKTLAVTTTPGALERVVERTRVVELGEVDPELGPRVQTQTDTISLNGATTVTVYDGASAMRTTTTAEGRVSTALLDVKGRVVEHAVPGIEPIRVTYDALGRTTLIAQGTGASTRTTELVYGADGNVAHIIDAIGRDTSFTYDAGGRRTSTTLPGGRLIAVGYDDNGNVTSVTPPSQPAHTLDYTPVNLVDTYTPPSVLPGTDATSYDYNLDRDLELITRPDALTIDPSYDTAGRRSSLAHSAGTLSYTYSSTTGQLTSISGPGVQGLAFTYDGPLDISTTWSGTVTGSVERTFNADFRVISRTVNGANAVGLSYDADGLIAASGGLSLVHDPDNGLLTSTTAGAVVTSFGYDPFGDLAEMSSATPGFTLTITRDKLARITTLEETTGATTTTRDFQYAEQGWLEQVTTNGSVSATYTYDDNGNRLSGPGATTYSVDDQDRLLSAGTLSFTYTDNGELDSMTDSATSDVTTFDYDTLGNLIGVALPNGDTIEYVIDAMNRRVGKIVNGVLDRGWLYDGQLRIAAELDGANTVQAVFVYATRVNVPDLMIAGGATYRLLTDHLGSVRLVVNTATGAVAQELQYDEFGNVLVDTNPGFQPFGFAGGLYDPDTALVRFGSRDYQPLTGRWTAKDPIRFAGGDTNLYAYVANDPVNESDPSGLFPEDFATAGIPELIPNRDVVLPRITEELTEAVIDARERVPPIPGTGRNDQRDAFRHCMLSCYMAREYSEGVSWAIGVAHEFEGTSLNPHTSPSERGMDIENNQCGRRLARRDGDCAQLCYAAVSTGGLRVDEPAP